MIKLSSRRSGKNRVLHCSFQDAHCIQLASASRTHNLSMTAWLFCWGKSPAILQNTHTREKSVYQHAWFMRYRTHVMTTWLFVEGSPLRYRKMPMAVKRVFISIRGLSITGHTLWHVVHSLVHVDQQMFRFCEQDVYNLVVWCVAHFEKFVVEPSCQCLWINLGCEDS